jgi:hypothetical protein
VEQRLLSKIYQLFSMSIRFNDVAKVNFMFKKEIKYMTNDML